MTNEEILQSKLRSQGGVINAINEQRKRLERRCASLEHMARGHPTPRVVKQIKAIREAAGTNSLPKILRLIERGQEVSG